MLAIALAYMFYRDRKEAIRKAQRGEFGKEDADLALENAKQYVDQEQGVIVGKDDAVDEEMATGKRSVAHVKV